MKKYCDAGKGDPVPERSDAETRVDTQCLGELEGIAQSTPQTHSVLQNKNLLPPIAPEGDTRSKKAKHLNEIRDTARGVVASGQRVSESRLFELIGCPRYRADILRAMRQLRNFYPGKLWLVLDHGEWWLVPVTGTCEP